MDFQCDRCGQKYHVADEKLQGRAASRFKCKKCENMILLSVQGTNAPSVAPPPPDFGAVSPAGPSPLRAPTGTVPMRAGAAPRTSAVPGVARPRSATTAGPAYSAGAGRPSIATARAEPVAASPAVNEADENGWFAGIRDVPVGPVSRAEIQAHVNAGDITGDTLVWRDGFGDWRPLRAVPALKDLLPALRVVAPRPSQPPLQSFAESDGDATVISDQGPALVAAALKAAGPDRHDQRLQEAPTRKLSALTDEQLRGIRLPPVAERPSERPPAPAVAKAPPTRPPPPKAPPAAPPRATTSATPIVRTPTFAPGAPRKSDLLAKKITATESVPPPPSVEAPVARPEPAHSAPPAASVASAVSSPAPRDVLAPPPSLLSDDTSEALTESALTESTSARAPVAAERSHAEPQASPAAPSAPVAPGWDDPLFHPTTPPSPPAATSSSPRAVAAPTGAWTDPVFNSHPPPAPAAAPAVAPVALSMPVAAPVTNTGPIGVAVDVAPAKPRGLPRGAWVLFLGIAVFGVAGGIAFTRRPHQTEIAASVSEPATQPAQPERPAAPPPPVVQPAAAPAQPATSDMTFEPGDDSPAAREHRRHPTTPRPAQPAEVSASVRQAQLERQLGLALGGPVPNTPPQRTLTPPLHVAAPPSTSPNPPAQQAATPAAQGSAHTRDVVRERTATDQLERSGVVRRCWEQFKLRNPAAPPRRLSINVTVAESGQVSLRLSEQTDAMLSTCIETRGSSQVRSLGAGAPVRTTVAVSLD